MVRWWGIVIGVPGGMIILAFAEGPGIGLLRWARHELGGGQRGDGGGGFRRGRR